MTTINTKPTYMGEPADQGRIVPRQVPQGEGYAILRCGNTEVVISYSMLHHMKLDIPTDASGYTADFYRLERAIHAITCEASLGRTGDPK